MSWWLCILVLVGGSRYLCRVGVVREFNLVIWGVFFSCVSRVFGVERVFFVCVS